jgi:large-conductance mechanosensitive channel
MLIILSPSYQAQKDTVMQIDQKQWHEISKDVDYTENFIEESKVPKKNKHTSNTSEQSIDFSGLKYIFYFLIAALAIFLIVRIFGNFKSNTTVEQKTISIDSLHEIEENIHEVNLENLLKEALLIKKYQIALRLNFLIIIKLLSQKGKINWAKEKTNWEYYNELQDVILADQFKEIILSFETFWYGEHPLTESQYHLTEPYYLAFKKKLAPNE